MDRKIDPKVCLHRNIHPGRVDGTVTVCLDCRTQVHVVGVHYASGESADEQYENTLTKLEQVTPTEGNWFGGR